MKWDCITEDRIKAVILEGTGKHRAPWQKWTAVAVGFCLAVFCTIAIALLPDHSKNRSSNPVLYCWENMIETAATVKVWRRFFSR